MKKIIQDKYHSTVCLKGQFIRKAKKRENLYLFRDETGDDYFIAMKKTIYNQEIALRSDCLVLLFLPLNDNGAMYIYDIILI